MVNSQLPTLINKIKIAKSPESVDLIGKKIEENVQKRLKPIEIMMSRNQTNVVSKRSTPGMS